MKVADKYEIVFDTSDLPEIKPWVDETLKPICAAWYPKIVELLPSENYSAPTRFTIIFEKYSRGVAYANRGEIHCAGPWFMRNLEGEAAGAVVHEMVHIVQQYRRARGPNRNPGWMVEGVADYIRWFLYEPEELRRASIRHGTSIRTATASPARSSTTSSITRTPSSSRNSTRPCAKAATAKTCGRTSPAKPSTISGPTTCRR